MKKLNLNAIRIDGGTQSRVEINTETVGDYAEAVKAGIEFPPIVVFHDGADHWLADGFHRFHAHKQAGKASIEAEVHGGTVRDAVLHSLGANRAHGLRMTNADKRKSVATLLADPEWAKWSDRKIAEICGVTHPFVAGIRAPKVVTVTTQPKTWRDAGVVTVTTLGAKSTAVSAAETGAPPHPEPSAGTPESPEDFGPSDAEIAAAQREQEEELTSLRRIAESDDKLKSALDENRQLRAQVRVMQERINSLMNEKNAAIQAAKRWEKKARTLERATA